MNKEENEENEEKRKHKDDKVHIIFPYIIPKHPAFGWELMYSIRSIYANFKEDFDITIIGEIPDWIDSTHPDIHCIEFDNSRFGKRVATRTNQKLLLAADMVDDLLWMNDDIYILRPVVLEDFKTPFYISDSLKYHEGPEAEKGLNTFKKLMRYTWLQLQEKGKPNNFNFSSHVPMYFQSDKIKELDREFNITSIGDYTTLTSLAYYNYFEIPGKPVGDFRVGYWEKSYQSIITDNTILNHNENGFWHQPWIISFLNKLFPKPSPIEK